MGDGSIHSGHLCAAAVQELLTLRSRTLWTGGPKTLHHSENTRKQLRTRFWSPHAETCIPEDLDARLASTMMVVPMRPLSPDPAQSLQADFPYS